MLQLKISLASCTFESIFCRKLTCHLSGQSHEYMYVYVKTIHGLNFIGYEFNEKIQSCSFAFDPPVIVTFCQSYRDWYQSAKLNRGYHHTKLEGSCLQYFSQKKCWCWRFCNGRWRRPAYGRKNSHHFIHLHVFVCESNTMRIFVCFIA